MQKVAVRSEARSVDGSLAVAQRGEAAPLAAGKAT
jgi:hypothetical protein